MTKLKVTFPEEAEFTIVVEAPENTSKACIIKMMTDDMVWDGRIDCNTDVVRDSLTQYLHAENPLHMFYVEESETFGVGSLMNYSRTPFIQKKDRLEQELLIAESMVKRHRIMIEIEQVEVAL